ncbi:hypothetical protein N7474_006459 [Penicillium riverlandense]|uniref:uncharacterized protein n=1 Tax=Penicillium riverlandense TaxID=1903569 RepID=UPI0025476E2C|nr:uncharacterized protein N7474_006459 [Penicillium riverlandense]KAJ5814682.1 hypothetical protein N7474_006459 [Penicillium riverlandense]
MKALSLPIILSLTGLTTARTVLSGCVSSLTTDQYHEASMIWYVPGTGEICAFPDCGGGTAPPKTDQPGCPLYTGTATLTSSYLPGWGPSGKMAASTSTAKETMLTGTRTATSASDSMITTAPTTSVLASLTTTTLKDTTLSSSTSAAPNSTTTGNAASIHNSNIGGVMGIVAAVVGVMAL